MSHLIHWIVENGHIKLANLFITSDYLNLVEPDRDNLGRWSIHSADITGHEALMTTLIEQVVLFPREPDVCYKDRHRDRRTRKEEARPSCFESNFDYISIKDSTESTLLLLAVQNFQAKIDDFLQWEQIFRW